MNIAKMFKGFRKEPGNKEKKELYDKIQKQAWKIAKSVPLRRCKIEDINTLSDMYKKYFILYPDIQKEIEANKRITQLKTFSQK